MINGIIDELFELCTSLGCDFSTDLKDQIIATMKASPTVEGSTSVMYQDYLARRPMEIETFLGSPLKLAKKVGITLPRLEVIYALLHDKNQKNRRGETPPSPGGNQGGVPPRTSSMPATGPGARPQANGVKNRGMGSRAPSLTGHPAAMRRGPHPNGYRMANGSTANGFGGPGGPYGRRDSIEGETLEEFSHVMLYESVADGPFQDGSSGSYGEPSGGGTPTGAELALKERELALRQRELELKEREHQMRQGRRGPPSRQQRPPPTQQYDDEDDEDDYFDPMGGGPGPGGVDDNIDMMSITSRRHRKMPSAGKFNYQQPPAARSSKNGFARKNRSSTTLMTDMPSPHDSIMNNPLLGYSSNRYGTVDRQALEAESRHNSMTGAKMEDMARAANVAQYGGPRRISHSPGNPMSPPGQRPSPPNGYTNGMRPGPPMANGRPSPPGGVRQPVPRHPPGHGGLLAPHQVEQPVGVSTLHPPKPNVQVRSLTGSASVSAKSGESASANTGSANSAASSSSSLQPRPQQIAVAVPP
jgi:Ketopantoate reductase PanE/ApbA C terminal